MEPQSSFIPTCSTHAYEHLCSQQDAQLTAPVVAVNLTHWTVNATILCWRALGGHKQLVVWYSPDYCFRKGVLTVSIKRSSSSNVHTYVWERLMWPDCAYLSHHQCNCNPRESYPVNCKSDLSASRNDFRGLSEVQCDRSRSQTNEIWLGLRCQTVKRSTSESCYLKMVPRREHFLAIRFLHLPLSLICYDGANDTLTRRIWALYQ